ncbi:MAG: EamA family transporter [Actinomycetota bacterium]
MAVFLGLLVAAGYGSGDFLGGRAARDAPALGVLFFAQCTALVGAVVAALVVAGDPTPADLTLGVAAGVANAGGLGLLYRGLATGRMGVVAPVTAVVAAIIPIAWGLGTGERPSAVTLVGVVVAVAAGGVVAREPESADEPAAAGTRAALLMALGAGVLFGWSFVAFAETGDGSGFWPVLTARVAAVIVVGVAVMVATRRLRGSVLPRDHPRPLSIAAGALDVGATVLLLTAVRKGLVVVVAPLAALAPAFTVVWARTLLREPVTRPQVAGRALSLTGLVLIAAG